MKGLVSTSQGRLRGTWRGDLWSFSGVPYARAPVGQLRWRPPLPPEPWEEIRDASTFGPIAPQAAAVGGVTSPSDPDASEPQSEDCLFLNVWTPSLDPDARRPVMVFIHGGGFTSGSGSVFLYRGGNLVRNGDAVVVTINYRLGALGFLGHRQFADPDGLVGNWGIQDQVAALGWVREHIVAFGGNPDNVTIFGESAGGFSVATLLGCPAARGLFRRAIVQSGGVHMHSIDEAERAADRLAAALGVASCDRTSLEHVPATELVAATAELGQRRPDPGLLPLPFLPVVDGTFLPVHPLDAVTAGSAADVDLIIGTNRDELTLFGLGNPALFAMDEKGLERWMANSAPEIPPLEVIEAYREARGARSEAVEIKDVWVAAGTDIVFRWPSLQLAAAHGSRRSKTFTYLFDWESPAFDGLLGSTHALELPFVFGAVHVPVVQMFSGGGPAADTLSRQMQMAWLAFATRGDPSHEGIGEWRQWERTRRATMVFGAHTGLVDAPRDTELAVLEQSRPLPSAAPPRG